MQLKLEVPGHCADALSDVCLELGAVSALLDNAGADSLVEAVLEPAPGATIVWERVGITAYWEATADIVAALQGLQAEIHDKGIFAEVDVNFRSDDDLDALPAQQVEELSFADGQLWLLPRDADSERLAALKDVAVIQLDPGLAFGSGLHPTTQLCLEAMARLPVLAGANVLDFGCGSGVLALGALVLGAARADGVDHDPQALVATADNAAYNGVAKRMHVFMPGELPGRLRYQVVVANILANPLIELADELSERLLPGGTLILAGLLAQQADAVIEAYPTIKFAAPVAQDAAPGADSWVCLLGVRAAEALSGVQQAIKAD